MLRRIAVAVAVAVAAGCGDSGPRTERPADPVPKFDKSVDQKKVGDYAPGP